MENEEQKNPANQYDVFSKVNEAISLLSDVVQTAIRQSYRNGIAVGKKGYRKPYKQQ